MPLRPGLTEASRRTNLKNVKVEVSSDIIVSEFNVGVERQLIEAKQGGDNVFVFVEGIDRNEVFQPFSKLIRIIQGCNHLIENLPKFFH